MNCTPRRRASANHLRRAEAIIGAPSSVSLVLGHMTGEPAYFFHF
jgi:hypothetical protein